MINQVEHNQTEILEVSNFEWKLTTNHFDFFSKLIFASNFDYNIHLYTRRDVYVFLKIISLDKLIIINMRISLIFPAPVNEKQTDVAIT